MNLEVRLALMNFLEFAVWGAYLAFIGRYLGNIGIDPEISYLYSMQGVVSIFMPALMGIITDRWVPAQRLLDFYHLLAGLSMFVAAGYGLSVGNHVNFSTIFTLYSLSVVFYMPTLALSDSVAYSALSDTNMDTVKAFLPIRVFGTTSFILTIWLVDILGFQSNQNQFTTSGVVSILLFLCTFTLPRYVASKGTEQKSFVGVFGLRAFALSKEEKMATFSIFPMLLGVSLQITNSFTNPFLFSFGAQPEFVNSFGVQHANISISLSQVNETCCILLIPFFMRHCGIKNVMLIAMSAWVLHFGLFGVGNPGSPGILMFVLSMIVYGVAFDLFNISGSLLVDSSTGPALHPLAQGLFMLMTNGVGATVGALTAQAIINVCTHPQTVGSDTLTVGDWQSCWSIFTGYTFVAGILFAIIFRPKRA